MAMPLLLGASPAQAQNVIASAAVTPNTASTGVTRQVVITASIPSDNYLAGSALVQRLDAAGRVLAVLGNMRDDGLEGDTAAGDRVYSLRATVLENDPGQVTYRVSAAFKGAVLRVLSAPLTVTVSGVSTGVNITAPGNGAYINTPAITVSGSAGDANARVTVNGISGVVAGNRFTASVPLNEGPNTLTAVATNSNGATSTHSIVVTLDTTPPRVEVYSPLANAATTAERTTVTGLVNDIVVGTVNAEQARVTVNGVTAEVSNRSFIARNVPLSLGANTMAVIAEDRAGNRATTSVTIQRLAAAGRPGLTILSGDGQAGAVGRSLPSPLVVKLTDAAGAPQSNAPVVFKVRTLDGVLSTAKDAPGQALIAVKTDASGTAQAWLKLGSRSGAGNNLIQASAAGVATTADFVASGQPGGPALMVVDSGNNQYGVIGQPLPLPFIAIVTDAMNNRLANVPVTLTVTQGGGTFPTTAGNKTSIVTNSDGDGRIAATLTLGPAEGIYNNVVEASFANNPGFAAAFMATGLAPAPADQTRITGVVLDNSNQPLQGVTMRLLQINQGNRSNLPQQVANPVVTDAQGQFTMTGVPVGVFKLMADGGTAQRPGTWPTLEFDMVTVSGQNNTVGMPIFLPELLPQNRLCVSENTGGTLTVPEVPGFALTIKPGSATFPGGARAGCVSVTPVHMDKSPMSPGFGQQPRFLVTIQPVGTHFNPPAQMTMPNVDGLLPGVVTEMYSYDHDLASFVSIGSATVSRDGSTISSDAGVGVMKAGWHCGGNPNSSGSAGTCPTCQKCSGSNCVADNGQTPPQASPTDCKEQYCSGGSVATRNKDSETPTDQCKKCQGGSPVADTSKDGNRTAQGCCFNGEAQPIHPIADLAKCPRRSPNASHKPGFNGCGGSGISSAVPDNPMYATHFADLLYLAIYGTSSGDFTNACNGHDICYDTCNSTKSTCDSNFGGGMDAVCDRDYSGALATGYRLECKAFSSLYRSTVSAIESFYEAAQKNACDCCP